MILVSFTPAEGEIQASTPDDAVPGKHRAGLRDIQGEPDQHHWQKMLILSTTQMNSGLPQTLSVPKFSPISPEEPILWYLPHFPITACAFTFRTGYGLSRAEIKAYSSFKLSRGLTSCLTLGLFKKMYSVWVACCHSYSLSAFPGRCSSGLGTLLDKRWALCRCSLWERREGWWRHPQWWDRSAHLWKQIQREGRPEIQLRQSTACTFKALSLEDSFKSQAFSKHWWLSCQCNTSKKSQHDIRSTHILST